MAYEVWCHSCNVTFPVGTKTCMHCGSRTHTERPHRSGMFRRAQTEVMPSPLATSEELQPALGPLPFAESGTETEEAPARRSLLRAGMTVVWMILLAGGYAWRACSQQ